MNEREQANQFQTDLEAWLERGQMPDAPESAEAPDPQGVSETSKAYRQALATAGRLSQANPGADPGFRLGLEKRLRERARAELPGLARRSRVREEFATALRVGAGAVLVVAFVLGLSFIFKSVTTWAGGQSTPTPEPTSTPYLAPTVLVQEAVPPTAIPLIAPSTIPENPPDNCPVTKPQDPPFKPPDPYPANPPGTDSWYGTDSLWTAVPQNGIWYGLPQSSAVYFQKVFWWSNEYSSAKELNPNLTVKTPNPNLTVTGRRLDGDAPPLVVSKATNAYAADIGLAMLVGVDIPTSGCWELTGQYAGATLSFTVWVAPSATQNDIIPTPSAMLLPVTQSRDGNWTTYTAPEWQQNGESIEVSAIAVAPDGAVWAGTQGGAVTIGTGTYRFDQGSWTRFTDQDGPPFMEVNAILAAPDDRLWFATSCCGLSSFDGKRWTTYTTANGLPSNDLRSLVFAPDGALWLGTEDKGVVRFDGKGWQNFTMERDGLWGNMVTHSFLMPDGSLLFSTSTSWPYLSRFDGQTWSQYVPQGGPVAVYTSDITTAADGSVWFATSEGVYRFDGEKWTHFTSQDGLASNMVFQVVAAPNNVLWFGTDRGLSRFDGTHWTTFTTQDGLASDWISSLAMAPDGTLWVGTAGGISRGAPALSSPAPTVTPAVPLSLQSSHNDIRALMFNPTWRTLWVQGQATTYSSVGVQENTYMQAWLARGGAGRVISTDQIPGSLGFTLDMSPHYVWVSDGQNITLFDAQLPPTSATKVFTGQSWAMHPLENSDLVLGIIFPKYLIIRSEDLQVLRMDELAGRLALVANWASYRIWIDAQTGVLLRSQTLDQNGEITSDIQVQAILYDAAIPADELSTQGLDQARFEPAPAVASTASSTTGPESTPAAQTAKIVFSANTSSGAELFVTDPQGQNLTQLTHDSAINTGPACSVDGKLIAFTTIRDNQRDIFLINPDGSGETRLMDSPFDEGGPAFSPDGQKIAFFSTRDGNSEIYVMALDGSGLMRLTDNPANDDAPAWSPDGKKIAFWSSQRGKGTQEVIYVMTRTGEDVTPLTGEPQGDRVERNFGPA